MRVLATNVTFYIREHNGVYPPADRWCDELVAWSGDDLRNVIGYPAGESKRCPFAMNPHADSCSPPDLVLLFESKPGWNQNGGPELLTTENHQGKGCTVLFTDLHVEFVKTGDLAKLKWTYADADDANHPAGSTPNPRD